MKQITATKRMLGRYLHQQGNEPTMVTARSINHYCADCVKKIEI